MSGFLKKHWLIGATLLFLLVLPFFSSEYVMVIAMQIFIWGAFAISYDLLIGYSGIVSFGHAMFFGTGAYASALLVLKAGLNFWAAIPIGVVLCGLLGLLIGLLTLRFSDIYFTMITLAIGQFLYFIIIKTYQFTGGDDGLHGLPMVLPGKTYLYYLAFVFLVLIYFVSRRLIGSPLGTTLVALRENEFRAKMIGYNVLAYKLIVLIISGMIAGLAGSLNGAVLRSVFPGFMHADATLSVILMTIIGGMGSLLGPILGAALVTVSQQYLSSYFESWRLIFGVLFVLIVLFLPKGMVHIFNVFKFRKPND
ncbi:MAG: branched-chain amino acid ABC transporter permease [Deltaproteobacteria bacterium]|nr:branched-chain amino acid ABC transporter permease [Deltaproteobacteria bacterium]